MKPSFFVFDSILLHAESGPTDHRKDAPQFILPWCYNFTMLITLCTIAISYSTGSVAVNRLQDLNIESSLVVYTVGVDCIWQKMYSQQYPDVLFS